MIVAVGIASRQGPDKNPILARCIDSLRTIEPGIEYEARVEVGEHLTRGEKRQRIFTWARMRKIPYLCILEDDTVIVDRGWLAKMVTAMMLDPLAGMMNPLETKTDEVPGFPEPIRGIIIDSTNMFGFCILYAMDWNPVYDPRVVHMDDLAMSLACRAEGRRVLLNGHTTVKHTKEPFMSDETPPWDQQDRERWGEDSVYYSRDKHFEARLIESNYLIGKYGDMASAAIPPELMKELWERSQPQKEPITGAA